MIRLALALISLLVPLPVFAQALPNVDIERYCLKKSGTAGPTNDFYGICVDGETATLRELKENWNDYSSASRRGCLLKTGNGGFYGDLQACIEAAEALRITEGR